MNAYFSGLGVSFGLILAIGAQNAFVLRQGLRREHILTVVLICAISDALLIAFGVGSFHQILTKAPWIEPLMRYGGAGFLCFYGIRSLRAALQSNEGLKAAHGDKANHWRIALTCLALTWLNPHVYLDTVLLIGSISSGFPGEEMSFAIGAMSTSFIFFFSLGFGALLLRPWLSSPLIWRFIELSIALIMWFIALKLLFDF